MYAVMSHFLKLKLKRTSDAANQHQILIFKWNSISNGSFERLRLIRIHTAVCRIIKGFRFFSSKRQILRGVVGAIKEVPRPFTT